MPRRHQIVGLRAVGHGSQDGSGSVGGGNSGGHSLARLNGYREIGPETRTVALGHKRQLQSVGHIGGHRQANESPSVFGHKINDFGCDKLGRNGEIALIFPVLVIHQNNHFALAYIVNSCFSTAHGHIANLVQASTADKTMFPQKFERNPRPSRALPAFSRCIVTGIGAQQVLHIFADKIRLQIDRTSFRPG